jgi:hypothetical protein
VLAVGDMGRGERTARLACNIGLHSWLGAGPLPPNLWLAIGFPLVMLVFAVLLLSFGDYLVRDEPEFLVEFLERTIGARGADKS